jgi:tetratricopeptide (TPR) repeat protein
MCREALAQTTDGIELRLLLAKALMALRRDAEAQVEVAHCLRQGPKCPDAYQILGELAFRRDELNAAEIFFREALRLNPEDVHSRVLLDIIQSIRTRPAAAAAKLPAASAAAGPSFIGRKKGVPSRLALGSDPGLDPDRKSIAKSRGPERIALEVAGREGGFGEYLVHMGVLTRQQLFAVLSQHYRDKSRIGDAAVRLGYAKPDVVEQYARAYHGNP